MKGLLAKWFVIVSVMTAVLFIGGMDVEAASGKGIPYEWKVAKRLIQNYESGQPGRHLKVDLDSLEPLRIYAYVYSVIPERMNVHTNTKNQEIWIAPLKNQNYQTDIAWSKKVVAEVIKKDMTEIEKIAAIHDWIVLRTTFAKERVDDKAITEDNIWAYSADGVFLKKRAVCSGYAAAFKMMCQEAGIPCYTVNSRAINHTWNAVYYKGAWRFIDASAETRASSPVNIGSIHRYFMMNQAELPSSQYVFDASAKESLSVEEYLKFFDYMAGKVHDSSADSVHMEAMELLAKKKNKYAMFEAGACYQKGRYGCPIDPQKCFEWEYQAAMQGHVVAQNNVGFFYKNGSGTEQSYGRAFYWYSVAADQGYAVSQVQLGNFYQEGLYVPENLSMARFWYQKAAKLGSKEAVKRLEQLS